jgi:pimeloyl-ACP methyl ester carboxylesterase
LFRRQIRIPGTGRALLSLFRYGALGNQVDQYVALNRQPRPLMVLRGDQDTILPQSQFNDLRETLTRTEFVEIASAPHAFVITDPEKLAPHIVRFLARGGNEREGGISPASVASA